MDGHAFFAYPASPATLGETIERALAQHNALYSQPGITSWRALDVPGHFIGEEVNGGIQSASLLVADITYLNFNVTYEVGLAIGLGKRVYLVRNRSFTERQPSVRELGVFDSIGYIEYTNSDDLRSHLKTFTPTNALAIPAQRNRRAPVFVLEAKHKTDWIARIISRIKKARYIFRNFDPNESPRLSGNEAIAQVAQSYGVLVPLLSTDQEDFSLHNLRAAFIAGLAVGMERPLCIVQQGSGPVPMDVRDSVSTADRLEDLNDIVAEFASLVAEAFQDERSTTNQTPPTFLQTLNLGASSAENEMKSLHDYYLTTEAFLKALRGEAHLVVGRKGSGKSAVFLQVRDRERSRDPARNIVLDLKPEGYKLVKFKELVLQFMQEGTLQHTITAFWGYVLLLEICYKILEKDARRHLNDHVLFDSYKKLEDLYNVHGYFSEGDFSERIGALMERIQQDYQFKYGSQEGVRLTSAQVTELLYHHDVRKIELELISYMKHKGVLWLLFDNVDKGWPTTGLAHEDLIIIRCLIDASRKIEREFSKQDVAVNTIVFLRNDVYELLVQETSDRGKEANVMLDWTDSDLLRELVRLRIVSNGLDESLTIDVVWPRICTPLYKGEDSLQFLIERSLMRPRFLLNLINQCKASAVNLKHQKIEEQDVEKGLAAFSIDVLTDVEYEMNDISAGAGDVLYSFIDSKRLLTKIEVLALIQKSAPDVEKSEEILRMLLWYGFLGVQLESDDIRYIYDFSYSMRMLSGFMKSRPDGLYAVNPAFDQALTITRRI